MLLGSVRITTTEMIKRTLLTNKQIKATNRDYDLRMGTNNNSQPRASVMAAKTTENKLQSAGDA